MTTAIPTWRTAEVPSHIPGRPARIVEFVDVSGAELGLPEQHDIAARDHAANDVGLRPCFADEITALRGQYTVWPSDVMRYVVYHQDGNPDGLPNALGLRDAESIGHLNAGEWMSVDGYRDPHNDDVLASHLRWIFARARIGA